MYQEVFHLHAQLLKAISHPKRLEIIHLLRERQVSVSEMQIMLGLPQANLSQHLQILRRAQVVTTRKDGKQIYYRIAHRKFIAASDAIRDILIERHADSRLGDEFAKRMSDLVPLVHDPVCGMRVSPKTASNAMKYQGIKYYFCASGCRGQFEKRPEKFVTHTKGGI